MIKSVVFTGRKEFTAEYYATEIKNRSYKANQDNGYYKGYGNELAYGLISDTVIRINSGLFLVAGRQCAVILGSAEDVTVPVQSQKTKAYIIARINTAVTTGENVSITYKLGTASALPSLVREDTYNIDSSTSATYELPLYSFDIHNSITNVQKLIKPIANEEVEIDDGSGRPSDYLSVGGLFLKKSTI